MRQYEENGYLITEYDSGSIVKDLITSNQPQEQVPQKTLEERIEELNEQNLVLMDAFATLFETVIGG